MPSTLLEDLRRVCAAQRLLPQRARVVVGVSGGADSVALLDLLHRVQPRPHLTLLVAHLDHGLRSESADDARFVAQLAASRGVPALIERRDVGAACAEAGWSLEDGARRIRYRFFADAAVRHSATHVALAHTADDQAETVLMRILAGTGLLGLGGIRIARPLAEGVQVIRPLLPFTRAEVIAYVTERRLAHREDASNQDRRFLRNRVRLDLLPQLERDYNPQLRAALRQLAEQSQDDHRVLEAAAGRVWRRLSRALRGGGVALSVEKFLGQPAALQRQLLRRAIAEVRGEAGRLEFRHWLEVEQLFRERPSGSVVDLPGSVQLKKESGAVVLRLRDASQSRYTAVLHRP